MAGIAVTGHVPQPDLTQWLSRATVLVLPSIEDGYGLVLLQAMACGCPVIATTHSGGPDCVADGRNGFVVPAGDADALAAKLAWLAEHPADARAMRNAAISEAAQASNVARYGDAMVDVYHALLADGPAAAAGLAA
jgi:glycosyltransferase involved in cell wall biosynthesis